jgi:hypothetical protein
MRISRHILCTNLIKYIEYLLTYLQHDWRVSKIFMFTLVRRQPCVDRCCVRMYTCNISPRFFWRVSWHCPKNKSTSPSIPLLGFALEVIHILRKQKRVSTVWKLENPEGPRWLVATALSTGRTVNDVVFQCSYFLHLLNLQAEEPAASQILS